MGTSRIPVFDTNPAEGAHAWFANMGRHRLLFHPADAPRDTSPIETGKPTFAREECRELDGIMQQVFAAHGNAVINARYPTFMHAAGLGIEMEA